MKNTPLRYPGGKAKFAPVIKHIIEKNNLHGHYVEPYAGGAGVALDLLFSGYCTDIHINDLDLAIYYFWKSITEQTEDFIRLANDTKVTIEEWHKQKNILKEKENISPLEYGFAAFFLNRTNRSGILKAGVIGGLNQTGNYKLDSRFNKADLIQRIERIGSVAKHIHVTNFDTEEWLSTLDDNIPANSLIYLDPPYYEKGQGLYRNYYQHKDHVAIQEKLAKVKESVYGDETTVDVFVDDSGKAYIMQSLYDYTNKSTPFTKITLIKKTEAPLYTGPVVVPGGIQVGNVVQPIEIINNIADDKTALGESSGAAVKGKRIAPGKDVKVADIEVVFEDGTKVPDGVTLDNFRMKDIWAEPAHYKVKDGKISGIVLKADEQYKLGFDVTNADYNNYEVVGAYKSKKLLRVYARYEGGVLLKYDYDEGIEAPEEEISKIVVRKTNGKPSEPVKSTSCLMNLILSDHGYQPQGVLPFRLVRLDNKKSTLVYSSKDGILSLNGEAGVWYEMKLDKNPLYKLKNKTVFRFVLNKEGKYVALLKGYKNPDNLEGVVTSYYVDLIRLDGKIPVGPALDTDECATGAKYSLKDYKIIYNTKRAAVKDIPVQFKSAAFKKPVKFEVYNATKQKVEKVVLSKSGKLSGLKLIVGNDYIISVLDKEYSMKNAYVTISNDGKKLITSKAPYGEFKGFKLAKREKALTDEKMANRVPYKLPVYVLGNNKKKVNNVTLKFISPRETFEAKVVDGWVDLSLLEDTNYVMEVVKGNYAIDAFPLTVKDKSEFGAKKYVFNHLSCGSVQALYLINKKQAHKNDTTLVSSDGTTKVTGFRFGNGEYALSSRVLKNVKVPELKGKNYLVLDVDTVNMYRVELSPLAHGNFKVTTTVAGKKPVKNVYYIDGTNKLQKVKFTQKGDKLTFNMDSMARYNTVIEYK